MEDVNRTMAYNEAVRLACILHAKHYPELKEWKPLDDLRGVISQIDNLTCGLVKEKISDGWLLVPKNPTPEMLTAARFYATDKWTRDGHGLALTELYRDMLAAAPTPPKDAE